MAGTAQWRNKLLDVIKHPLDPERFHRLLTKTQWFVLFNILAIAGLLLTGRIEWSLKSLVTSATALLVVNFVAMIRSKLPRLEIERIVSEIA
jgi:hypothetical protein